MNSINRNGRALAYPPKSLSDVIRNFTPNWFTVTMGTGVLALVLNQFPVRISGIHGLAAMLWLGNIALFVSFSVLYAARWLMFFDEARRIFHHPVMSMFFGAIPMGLATIINGFLAFGPSLLGPVALPIAWTLWWVDAGMAVVCGLAIPFFMFTRQEHSMERLTAVWLLPVVAAEVAASSGALITPHLVPQAAFTVLVLSYVLWAYSVPLAMSFLVLLVLRLALHKLPDSDMGVSALLALGPIGTGALGLVLLGTAAPSVLGAEGLRGIGDVAFGLGILGGVLLWGYGVWWLGLAVLKIAHYLRDGLPFNLGWWGFTFPLGVYTLASFALGRATHFMPFMIAGYLLAVALAMLWVIVATRTACGAWRRDLFSAPCLAHGRVVAHFEADAV